MLWTTDIKGSVDFYTSILGFSCDQLNVDRGWASVSRDDVSIMFALPNEHTPFDKPTFTGSLYFNTDDVDSFWEDLKGNTRVCYEIENFDYGMREFAVYDNNGYLLQFGQPIG